MKSTTFIAILLTFLTLLLVAGATAIFLYQGRLEMQEDIRQFQSVIAGHERTFAELQTTAVAREIALSTSEAAAATSQAALNERQTLLATREAEVVTLEAARDDATATAEAEPTVALEPPVVEIVSPQFGADVTTDTALQIIVVGLAAEGIDRLDLMVGDRAFEHEAGGETYRVFNRGVPNLSAGMLTITATLTTEGNQSAQDVVRVFVRSLEPEPEEDSTQGALYAPLAIFRP